MRPPAQSLVVLLALLAVAGCEVVSSAASPTASAARSASGIRGRVILGPTCPVQAASAPPCLTPYAAQLVVTRRDEDREVARVSSGADGAFELQLPPGEYQIVPQPGDPFPHAQPLDVTVVEGHFAHVEINYDTGIR